jgi:hypothetical protein
VTFTGWPESSVGVNFHCRTAETADCCKSGCPLTAAASLTRPDSSTVICTVTVPEARAARAMAGYSGAVLLMALPFRTPPLIVWGMLRIIGGGGTSTAGRDDGHDFVPA